MGKWSGMFISPLLIQPATATASSYAVPFFSQFADISSPSWQKVGCGVTSLAMVIDYYKPEAVSVNALLKKGIAIGAYDYSAGWIYSGLISLAKGYGLSGQSYDYGTSSAAAALSHFEQALAGGPVIASVHYKFDPASAIPHLVVIDRMTNGVLYYNDPAAKSGELSISVADFVKGWKKRYIVLRPAGASVASAST